VGASFLGVFRALELLWQMIEINTTYKILRIFQKCGRGGLVRFEGVGEGVATCNILALRLCL